MKTLMNRIVLIAAGAVVLGAAAFGQTRIGKPEPPAAPIVVSIHLPCWLYLPHHFCRVEPRPLVTTSK